MIGRFRYVLAAGLALGALGMSARGWAQQTVGDRRDETPAAATSEADTTDTLELAPAIPSPFGPSEGMVPSLPPIEPGTTLEPLPPIPGLRYRVETPSLPPVIPGDTIVVPQITGEIVDPDLRAKADSLNRRLRILAIQDRLVQAEVVGGAPRVGLITREDYLAARLALLEDMEAGLKTQLKRRQAALDTVAARLDSTVKANREQEIEELEAFVERHPSSLEASDAKFILGQLHYARENQRFLEATQRFFAEFNRYRLNLIPVMPKSATMDESVAVPYYRDVVRLGTNPSVIPYSLYSLGKYHLEQARDYQARYNEIRRRGPSPEATQYQVQQSAHSDSAKAYFARLIVEYPNDSLNVPDALYVLASDYNLRGGQANRDTAAMYCMAIVRDHWYSPRYQAALRLLSEISFWDGLGTVAFNLPEAQRDSVARERNRHFDSALAYLAWLARDVDAFTETRIPGVTPDKMDMLDPGRRIGAVQFMTQIITRSSPLPGFEPPAPVETAVRLVTAAGNPPFGADLLRQVGDKKDQDYGTTGNAGDLVAALTAYDSLLSRYTTYGDGPRIQQKIIDNATFLSDDPQERLNEFVRQKILYFERFNRSGEWARRSDAPPEVKKAADDSAAAYLETGAKWMYTTAQQSGDKEKLRTSLDYFVTYFQTYPERPQAYELNWSLATELRDLRDYGRAYDEFMRVSNSTIDTYREGAALEAVAAAQMLIEQERQSVPPPAPESEEQGR